MATQGPVSRQQLGEPCKEPCRECGALCEREWYPHLVHLCPEHSL